MNRTKMIVKQAHQEHSDNFIIVREPDILGRQSTTYKFIKTREGQSKFQCYKWEKVDCVVYGIITLGSLVQDEICETELGDRNMPGFDFRNQFTSFKFIQHMLAITTDPSRSVRSLMLHQFARKRMKYNLQNLC